jgi:predicted transport protein
METKSCIVFVEVLDRREFINGVLYKCENGNVLHKNDVKEINCDLRKTLIPFLPENALDAVVILLQKHSIVLLISTPLVCCNNPRVIGRYSSNVGHFFNCNHKISIRNDLDKEQFLRTLLHEYAHLLQTIYFSHPSHHGWDFTFCFLGLIREFIRKNIISASFISSLSENIRSVEWIPKDFIQPKFYLKDLRMSICFEYENEIYEKKKWDRSEKMYRCIRISDNVEILMDKTRLVLPVFSI